MSDCKTSTGIVLSPQSNGFINWPVRRGHKNAPQSNGTICGDDFASFLFNDEFTTAQSPPLAGSRTTEPGQQAVTITDSLNRYSITGGELLNGGSASSATDPQYLSDDTFTATPGYTFGVTLRFPTTPAGDLFQAANFGFKETTGAQTDLYINSQVVTSNGIGVGHTTTNTVTMVVISLGEGGIVCIIKDQNGDWLSGGASLPTLTPNAGGAVDINSLSTNTYVSSVKLHLFDEFTPSHALATGFLSGSISQGITYTHTPDFFALFQFVRGSTDTRIVFRKQDSNNFWELRIIASASTNMSLHETIGGVTVQRAVSSGFGDNLYALIHVIDDDIDVWSQNGNVWQRRINFKTATTLKTETGGEFLQIGAGGSVSNFAYYPVDRSDIASTLDEMV